MEEPIITKRDAIGLAVLLSPAMLIVGLWFAIV